MAKHTEEKAAIAEPLPTFCAKLRHSTCPTAFVKVEAADEEAAKRKILANWPGDVEFVAAGEVTGDCTTV